MPRSIAAFASPAMRRAAAVVVGAIGVAAEGDLGSVGDPGKALHVNRDVDPHRLAIPLELLEDAARRCPVRRGGLSRRDEGGRAEPRSSSARRCAACEWPARRDRASRRGSLPARRLAPARARRASANALEAAELEADAHRRQSGLGRADLRLAHVQQPASTYDQATIEPMTAKASTSSRSAPPTTVAQNGTPARASAAAREAARSSSRRRATRRVHRRRRECRPHRRSGITTSRSPAASLSVVSRARRARPPSVSRTRIAWSPAAPARRLEAPGAPDRQARRIIGFGAGCIGPDGISRPTRRGSAPVWRRFVVIGSSTSWTWRDPGIGERAKRRRQDAASPGIGSDRAVRPRRPTGRPTASGNRHQQCHGPLDLARVAPDRAARGIDRSRSSQVAGQVVAELREPGVPGGRRAAS